MKIFHRKLASVSLALSFLVYASVSPCADGVRRVVAAPRETSRKVETLCNDAPIVGDAVELFGAALKPESPPPPTFTIRLNDRLKRFAASKRNFPLGATVPVPSDWRSRWRSVNHASERRFRRLALWSPSAVAVRVHIRRLDLPAGATLRIYGKETGGEAGDPATPPEIHAGRGPFGDGELWSNLVSGDTIYLEWTDSPGVAPFEPVAVSHFWRHPYWPPDDRLDCHLDASLYPKPEARSAVRLVFETDAGPGLASGVLVATPAGDYAPLVLTARHCISSADEARSVQVFWLYQSGGRGVCASPTGARLVAVDDHGDQTLLEILGVIPRHLCHSGWTADAPPVGETVVGWHHPGAGTPLCNAEPSVLRVSFGVTRAPQGFCSLLTDPNYSLAVSWRDGSTAHGSSGSGLWWERAGRRHLVGVLGCGRATCGASPEDNVDLYTRSGDFLRHAFEMFTSESDFGQGGARVSVLGPVPVTLVVTQTRSRWFPLVLPAGGVVRVRVTAPRVFGAVGVDWYPDAGAGGEEADDGPPVRCRRVATPDGETLTCFNPGPARRRLLRVFLRNDTRAVCRLTVEGAGDADSEP